MQKELDAHKVQQSVHRVELQKVAKIQKKVDAQKAKVDHVLLQVQMISSIIPKMIAWLATTSHVSALKNPIKSQTIESSK